MRKVRFRWRIFRWLGACLLLIILMPWLTRQFVFHPTTLPQDHQFDFDIPFEELRLSTADSVQIHGLFFPAAEPKGALLYLHGNADDLDRWGRFASDFTRLGFSVLMIDYRCFGKSDKASLTEEGLFQDALAAYHWLVQRFPPEDIVLYGRSLGSGIANRMAATVPARQLILETPYYSLTDMVGLYLPLLNEWLARDFPIPSNEYFLQHQLPTTIFHGTRDRVVPYKEGKRLAQLRPDATFITIPGGNHKNLNQYDLYHEELARVLA